MIKSFINGKTVAGEPLSFAVERGRFVAIGDHQASENVVDLRGGTVLPGFIDAHCHVMPTGLDELRLHLGECTSPEQTLAAVRDRLPSVEPGRWLMAVHYDQNRFDSGDHLHRDQLDKISATVPIVLRHVNGHASVANSAALQQANVDESVSDPKGGTFVRDASGRLTGVLLERAHDKVSGRAPSPSQEKMVEAILRAAHSMSKFGITCASDMMTGYCDLEKELTAYRLAAEAGAPIRFRLYAMWSGVFGRKALDRDRLQELIDAMDPEQCKVAGAKIFADGAIASATAAIHGEFLTGGSGQLIYSPERLQNMVATADAEGWSVSVHAIGDRATDHVLDAFVQTPDPSRHRIEHAMILSDGQIGRLADLQCHTAMQPEFLMRLGHAYHKQLPVEIAARLKRLSSAKLAGVRLSLNSDRPVVPGNPWDGIATASQRPDGFAPEENLAEDECIRLYTEGGADANEDRGVMGDINVGCLADFQVYAERPSSAEPSLPDSVYLGGDSVL